ncbi:MAG TPA: biotin/lipoyl-binding protein, partial [Phenylobacterium sp.]
MAGAGRGRLAPLLAGGAAVAAVAVGGSLWWANKQHYEATDNAFVAADKVSVAPQVDGYVTEVLVADNQAVRPGDLLVRIDASSIRARLAQAQANAAALEAGVRQVDDKAKLEQAMIAQRQAGVASAQAQVKWTGAELSRYGQLSKAGYASAQREQTARAAQDQAAAAVAQAEAALAAERQAAASLGSAREQTAAQAAAARAAVDQARIDLSRTE